MIAIAIPRPKQTQDFIHSAKMAAPMDERISVPIDDPNADTEW